MIPFRAFIWFSVLIGIIPIVTLSPPLSPPSSPHPSRPESPWSPPPSPPPPPPPSPSEPNSGANATFANDPLPILPPNPSEDDRNWYEIAVHARMARFMQRLRMRLAEEVVTPPSPEPYIPIAEASDPQPPPSPQGFFNDDAIPSPPIPQAEAEQGVVNEDPVPDPALNPPHPPIQLAMPAGTAIFCFLFNTIIFKVL